MLVDDGGVGDWGVVGLVGAAGLEVVLVSRTDVDLARDGIGGRGAQEALHRRRGSAKRRRAKRLMIKNILIF